jgi:cholesterol transport system auxiliary component
VITIRRYAAVLALSSFGCVGCALLGKADALAPRYFSPEIPSAAGAGERSRAPARADAPELRLGRITAASYLGERIVFRDSKYELDFYEGRRWSENPDEYLRRALSQSLFEEHGLHRIISGGGPTLEVELTEFAELRVKPPVARVSVTYILFESRLVRREASVTVDLPIAGGANAGDSPEPAVRALSQALNDAVARIVEQVIADLPPRKAPAEVTPPPAAI